MIRYYSATRPQTPWTRAMDIALVACLLLALPLVWVVDALVIQPVEVALLQGQVFRTATGDYHVNNLAGGARRAYGLTPGEPIGNFTISMHDHYHGWPLITSIHRQPARLDIDLRTEVRPRPNAQLTADDPLRFAITRVLYSEQQDDIIAAWPQPGQALHPSAAAVRSLPIAWLLATGIWWIILTFAAFAMIQVTKFGCLLVQDSRRSKRSALRAQGRCIACGYDMTGLEFNDRCPECGELVW